MTFGNNPDTAQNRLYKEIALSSLKLGCIGFGGITGMLPTIEHEMVIKRRWIDHQHFMDVVSASYIIPGPNTVEIIMHCGKEKGGRAGLIIAGICYILPSMLISLLFAFFYTKYSALPNVQNFIFGIRPATTALVIATVFRLSGPMLNNKITLIALCILVFAGSLYGINEVLLILMAGAINYGFHTMKGRLPVITLVLFLPFIQDASDSFSRGKLFAIFLKIGAVLYGSGYVLYAYMNESFVQNNHWLTKQQLTDSIALGQITPGPFLSSATFAGYLIDGVPGGILATVGIFLPSFFISFFLHRVLSSARRSEPLRIFLDGLSAASISIIAVVGLHLLTVSVETWRGALILVTCLAVMLLAKKISTAYIILFGSIGGFLLLMV